MAHTFDFVCTNLQLSSRTTSGGADLSSSSSDTQCGNTLDVWIWKLKDMHCGSSCVMSSRAGEVTSPSVVREITGLCGLKGVTDY